MLFRCWLAVKKNVVNSPQNLATWKIWFHNQNYNPRKLPDKDLGLCSCCCQHLPIYQHRRFPTRGKGSVQHLWWVWVAHRPVSIGTTKRSQNSHCGFWSLHTTGSPRSISPTPAADFFNEALPARRSLGTMGRSVREAPSWFLDKTKRQYWDISESIVVYLGSQTPKCEYDIGRKRLWDNKRSPPVENTILIPQPSVFSYIETVPNINYSSQGMSGNRIWSNSRFDKNFKCAYGLAGALRSARDCGNWLKDHEKGSLEVQKCWPMPGGRVGWHSASFL